MIEVTVIMTCFNRKEYTLRCINTLNEAESEDIRFNYVVVDDNSTDGTKAAVEELVRERGINAYVLMGTGSLFYSGGMRKGIEWAKANLSDCEFFMLVNDDVRFDSASVARMIALQEQEGREQTSAAKGRVLVGATKDDEGKYSYGGVRYTKGISYIPVKPEDPDRSCDTFNANCVLIPGNIFMEAPNMDEVYNHSLGDFDYGLSLKRTGAQIEVFQEYIGICNKNKLNGTWNDTSLSRKERIRKKESVKGLPRGEWYHFLKKNFGVGTALIKSVTPYIRILFGR